MLPSVNVIHSYYINIQGTLLLTTGEEYWNWISSLTFSDVFNHEATKLSGGKLNLECSLIKYFLLLEKEKFRKKKNPNFTKLE